MGVVLYVYIHISCCTIFLVVSPCLAKSNKNRVTLNRHLRATKELLEKHACLSVRVNWHTH